MGNWFLIWLLAWSVTAFVFYGYDKMQAKRSGWRIPEVVLHGLSLVGGFTGAILGMIVFHHKTSKNQFWAIAIGRRCSVGPDLVVPCPMSAMAHRRWASPDRRPRRRYSSMMARRVRPVVDVGVALQRARDQLGALPQ